jgi:hypothetical protein
MKKIFFISLCSLLFINFVSFANGVGNIKTKNIEKSNKTEIDVLPPPLPPDIENQYFTVDQADIIDNSSSKCKFNLTIGLKIFDDPGEWSDLSNEQLSLLENISNSICTITFDLLYQTANVGTTYDPIFRSITINVEGPSIVCKNIHLFEKNLSDALLDLIKSFLPENNDINSSTIVSFVTKAGR